MAETEAAQHSFVQWWWETHQSNPVTIKDLAPMALGNPSDEDSEGLLNVKGNTDRIRRANLINSWLDQTYDLEGVTVRVASGPRHHNRYQTWILQMPDSRVGAFPLLDPDPGYSLHELQQLRESAMPAQKRVADSGQKRACRSCNRPLLPDESGPDCHHCRPDPLGGRRMLTELDAPTEAER